MGEAKPKKEGYWGRRKDSLYLHASRQVCAHFGREPKSVLDVGSNSTPTLEWHRASATHLVSVDLRRPYRADGVESLAVDLFEYEPETPFDLVTCFQVLEHVPDAGNFARKLLKLGKVVVVSVPYKWPRGAVKVHVHDPVDEAKMKKWFGRGPDYAFVAREPFGRMSESERLIHVYLQPAKHSTPRSWLGRARKRVGRAVRRVISLRKASTR